MQRGKISILATENLKARFPGKFENGIFIHSWEAQKSLKWHNLKKRRRFILWSVFRNEEINTKPPNILFNWSQVSFLKTSETRNEISKRVAKESLSPEVLAEPAEMLMKTHSCKTLILFANVI